ncbi:MAG: S8 family serine peptidase [Thermoplasmata archaeon]
MMNYRRASLSFMLMILMVATSFVVLATGPAAAEDAPVSENAPAAKVAPAPHVDLEMKLDSALAERMRSSAGPFRVYLVSSDREAVNQQLEALGLPQLKGRGVAGPLDIRVMELDAKEINTLAASPGVVKIMAYERPQVEVQDKEKILEDLGGEISPPEIEDYDVDIVHGAEAAWMDGWTGWGVNIAVIDDGFDMAHPDLQGQQARYSAGPYAGWPMAYDDYASYLWSYGMIGGWVVDTTYTSLNYGGYVEFDGLWYDISGLRDVWGNPVSSQSGIYRLGYHPDQNLEWLWGWPSAVLLVDSVIPGLYDTVYVDVWQDFWFGNEKACRMGDEISYVDMYNSFTGMWDPSNWNTGDGFADLSGGMVYWISDGINVYPGSDWLWGADYVAGQGDAVAFVGQFNLGESHGTMTSSAALGNGASMWAMLMGMAPDARLVAIPFTLDVTASWLFAEFGPDAMPNTGDEANIVSNSYGWSETAIDAGYEYLDMLAGMISLYGGQTLWCWSSGNGGPGYGTTKTVTDFSAVHVGASTTQQYRYWLGYEWDYIHTKYGDVAPFSNSGPSKTGKVNTEIVASGMYSLEPAPLNYFDYTGNIGDGWMHFQIGSGTSHSTPTVAGGAALGFQAYYDLWGEWPYIDEAKAKLMAAADDMHYDPFKQGAGWLNAYTYTQLMGELSGTETLAWAGMNEPVFTKSALYPGFVYGERYESFANFLLPGQYDDTHVLATINYDSWAKTVNVTGKLLLKTGSDLISHVTTSAGSQYLDVTSYIPPTTDLLKVTMFMDMYEYDFELDYASDRNYWLEIHDWVDHDGDGMLDTGAGMEWELYRYTVDGSDCNYNQVMIRDPIDRTADGLIVRLRPYFGGEAGLTIYVQLDYYELQTFPWIQFRDPSAGPEWSSGLDLSVDAWSGVMFDVNVSVPLGTPVGTYGAAIYVDDGSRIQSIPVVINVPADTYEFSFGGPSAFDTPYNNDFTSVADRGWRFEVGDWRIFWSMPTDMPPSPMAYLAVIANWTELPTDVNLHVLAPVPADFWPLMWPFGPDTSEMLIASSDEMYMGAGTFGLYTSTGGPSEVIAAPLGDHMYNWMGSPAPFAIITRSPMMAGTSASDTLEGYTTWFTMNDYQPRNIRLWAPQPGPVPMTGSEPAWYDVTVSGPTEVRGSGEGPLVVETYWWEPVWQDLMTGNFVQDLANAAYTRAVYVSGSDVLEVHIWEEMDAEDLDLGVWYDADWDGVAELSEPYWYRGIGGSDETVTVYAPADGQYLIKVLGYTVSGTPGYFSMEVITSVPGYILATDLESPVTSGVHNFTVSYSVPEVAGTYVGRATFGFFGAADMFAIEFTIVVVDAPQIENLTPEDGSELGTNHLVVSFYFHDEIGSTVGLNPWSVNAWLDGTISMPSFGAVTVDGDNVTIDFALAVSDDEHYVMVQAADWDWNWAWSMTNFTVNTVIETFTAEFVDPGTGGTIPDGGKVALTDVAVEGWTDPYASVEIVTATATYTTDADDTGYYYVEPIALAEGLNSVRVTTTTLGGVSASLLKSITSDTICSLWVMDPKSPTADDAAELIGMTDADATLLVNSVPVPVNPDGTFGVDVTLVEGLNTFVLEATDSVGNYVSMRVEVELDTTAPSLLITSPSDGATVNRSSVVVAGHTDYGATVYVNGVLASNGTDTWSATVPLVEGANTITVTASDALGNSVTDSITVTYFNEILQRINDLADALAENVSDIQDAIDALAEATAADIADLQSQIDALTDLLSQEIADLEVLIGDTEAGLRSQLDSLNATLQQDMADLQNQLDALGEQMQDDIGAVDEKVDDTDAFASMLMYLTLALFAIAVILIGVVWYLMSGKVGRAGGGEGPSTEEVEEEPKTSDVEREFEELEKEM